MSNSIAAGTRVTVAIGVIKWLLIALASIAALVSILLPVVDTTTDYTIAIGIASAIGCAIWSLFVWVLFGWFEHTLSALITIARNTTQQLPGTYAVPPAPYEQHHL